MKNKLLIMILSVAAMNAEARNIHRDDNNYYEFNRRYFIYNHSSCVSEYITKLSEKESVAESCKQDQSLQLAWATQNYPNLHENPRRVQYWQGGYSKVLATTSTYLRELVDACRGRILSKMNFTQTDERVARHEITNPNLSPSVKESFMLVPMTEDEANQELAEAKKRCLAK
ncbi:MAG: hypothetical protein V4596_09160 [Bdellovibrionota bacterium]